MKVGPDGKIYIPKTTDSLDVIENPNTIGSGCNYQSNAILLAGRLSGFQLPNIMLVANHSAVGLAESSLEYQKSNVFPNPINEFAILKFKNSNGSTCTLKLFNKEGRLVREINDIRSNEIRIKREKLSSGIYFYHIQKGLKVISSGKLVII